MSINETHPLYCIESLTSSLYDVPTYGYQDFLGRDTAHVANFYFFEERYNAFTSLFALISAEKSDQDYYQLYIEAEGGRWLSVVLNEEGYFSNCLQEGALFPKEESYYHIKIYDDEKHEIPVAHIRFDKKGRGGELVYISKGKEFTGNEIKQVVMHIFDLFNVRQVVLFDVAEIELNGAGKKKEKVRLAHFLPIVSDEMCSWYGKDKFTPLACRDLVMHDEKVKVSQDPESYYQSVEKIRSFSLEQLSNAFKNQKLYKRNYEVLTSLQSRYKGAKTVSQLGKEIFSVMKKDKTSSASHDFLLYNRHILPVFGLSKKASSALQEYHRWGKDLKSIIIWQKTFSD